MTNRCYEVWALIYNEAEDNSADGTEKLLGEFKSKSVAVNHAKKYKMLQDVYTADEIALYGLKDCYVEIRVETVESDGVFSENVDTVYSENIYFKV